ncbi:DUF4884 domain-containing protein [Achromobacter animicus]|nr:DUF4884 domain-containing protein [Achromobacter animicus]
MLLAAVALAGCTKDPVAVSTTDNQDIPVAELFTHKGITVYRFTDGGRWVYFTSTASHVTAQHLENCGKACTRSVTVETMGSASPSRPDVDHSTDRRPTP